MQRAGEWLRRLGYLLNKRRMDEELHEEMTAHRAEMGDPGRFGNTLRLREESRDIWGWGWLEETTGDIRHGLRTITRMPIVAGVIVISLAMGIGVNTTVYTWIAAMILDPIPGVVDDSGIYLIEPQANVGAYPGVSWQEFHDLRERVTTFPDLAAFRMTPLTVGGPEGPERSFGLLVSDNYFQLLGVTPQHGRFFDPETVRRAGGAAETVISNRYWTARFDASPDVVGQTVEINGQPVAVIGVAPPGFFGTVFSLDFDLWMPATTAPLLFPGSRELESRDQRGFNVIGRLRSTSPVESAQAELDGLMADLAVDFPESNSELTATVLPFWQSPRGPQQAIFAGVVFLQGLMLLVLITVCVNTANLLLARAHTRGREVAIRMALGAGRWRVVRLLMTENLILAMGGATLGLVVAVWGTNALRAVPLPTMFPVRLETAVDAGAVALAAGLGLLSAALFGVGPALGLIRGRSLAPGRPGAGSRPRHAYRNVLMAGEAAVALAVLVTAGLFLGGFRETQTVEAGFDRDGVLIAGYDLSGAGPHTSGPNLDPDYIKSFTTRLLEGVRTLPEVEAASIAAYVPLDIHGMPLRDVFIPGWSESDASPDLALMNIVSPGYFRTMGIRLVAGRDFEGRPAGEDRPGIIVNEAFVAEYLDGDTALGQAVEVRDTDLVIVGVVTDSVYESFNEPHVPAFYRSTEEIPLRSAQIHIRTRPGAETLIGPAVRRVVRSIEPALPIFDMRTLGQHVDTNLFLARIPARMFALVAPMLLLLVAVGIYAVVAFNVMRRTREIGIRLALGATRWSVVREIVGQTLNVILIGAVAGWFLVYIPQIHLSPGDPLDRTAFFGVPGLLMGVAFLASWLPARRAARIDPMESLREE